MDAQTFLHNFATVADAPGGVQRLRDLVLELAVRGRLVEQSEEDEPASAGLDAVRADKGNTLADSIRGGGAVPRIPEPAEHDGDLPPGWEWARVDDTGDYVNGLAFKNSDWKPAGIPIIRIQNLTNPSVPFNYADGPFPEDRMAHDGDILVSWSATLNAFRWYRGDAVVNQHIFKVIPDHRVVTTDYLFHLLRYCIRAMAESEAAHGLVMKHINRGPFLSHVISLPPLAEQERIVAKVDELMKLCDDLEAGRERRHRATTRFRASALHALTEAETPDDVHHAWERVDANWSSISDQIESVADLEATILHLAVRGRLTRGVEESEKQGTEGPVAGWTRLPRGWHWKALQDLVDPDRSISYGVIKLGPDPGPSGVPTLRCSDVRRMWIDPRGVRHIDQALSDEYRRTLLRGGEHLVNVRGTLGGCAIVPAEMAGFNIAREVAVVPSVGIDPDYLLYVLASPGFLRYTGDSLRGTAYQGLNLSLLRAFPVPVPPAEEQTEIVERVRGMLMSCSDLAVAGQVAMKTSTALSRSLVAHTL